MEDNDDAILYNENNEICNNEILDSREYYNFKLKSKDFNLYRNINLIFYLESNMDKMIKLNTYSS
jgi:hypothetical protein